MCFNFCVFIHVSRGDITGNLNNIFGRFFASCTRLYMRIVYRPVLINAHNADIGEPVIYVSNHCGGSDGQFMLTALDKHRPRTLVAKEWYDGFFIHCILKAVDCIPIDRNSADIGWLRDCISCTRSGRSLLIFPEGTSTYDNAVHSFKSGFILAARACGVKIVPVWHAHYKLFRKTPVVIGDAYELSPDLELTDEGFAKECERFRNIVSELSEQYNKL